MLPQIYIYIYIKTNPAYALCLYLKHVLHFTKTDQMHAKYDNCCETGKKIFQISYVIHCSERLFSSIY